MTYIDAPQIVARTGSHKRVIHNHTYTLFVLGLHGRPICEVFSWDAWCPWFVNICLKWKRHWLQLWPMASFWIHKRCVKGWRTGRSMTWHMQLRILFLMCLGSSASVEIWSIAVAFSYFSILRMDYTVDFSRFTSWYTVNVFYVKELQAPRPLRGFNICRSKEWPIGLKCQNLIALMFCFIFN